ALHDPGDQLVVRPANAFRQDDEIAVDGMDAGQRVDFDEVGNAVAIAADVDARDVAQAERVPDIERDLGDARLVDDAVLDAPLVVALHLDGIEEITITIFRHHFHDADDLTAKNADGELASGEKLFDEHGTVLTDA